MDEGREEVLCTEGPAQEVKRHNRYIDGRWVNRKYKGKRRKRGRPKKLKSYRKRGSRPNSGRPLTSEQAKALSAKSVALGGRSGVPNGMPKAQAMVLWAQAREKSEWLMTKLEEAEVITFDPNLTEEQMARAALTEAFAIVMSPMGDGKERLAAIRTVLEWTKAKPATKTDLKLSTAEKWLEEVVVDHQRSLPAPSTQETLGGLSVLGETLCADQN